MRTFSAGLPCGICLTFGTLMLMAPMLCASDTQADEKTPTPPNVAQPMIPDRSFKITDYGAVGDGKTMNTAAITKAVKACSDAGGGTVLVPSGNYLTNAFSLASSLNLHLDRGATILFSNRFEDSALNEQGGYGNLLTATDCHDVAITGEGTIDGQGAPWWAAFRKMQSHAAGAKKIPHRPFMVVFTNCTRVLVQGLTLTNSPMDHLEPRACRDVTIDHVSFIAPAKSPNTDGIDPSGWNFLITHCTFDVGDDCIAIKADGDPVEGHPCCENIYVTDCQFNHGHGMSIGGQTPGGLRGLVVRDSIFEGTDAGIRLKAARGKGGLVQDCLYENLKMNNVRVPIDITSYYPERSAPKDPTTEPTQAVNSTTPIWRNIRITNVEVTGASEAGRIAGLPEMPVSDVTLTNVKITAEKGMDIWFARGVHFMNSQIIAKSPALSLKLTTDVTGMDPETGKPVPVR